MLEMEMCQTYLIVEDYKWWTFHFTISAVFIPPWYKNISRLKYLSCIDKLPWFQSFSVCVCRGSLGPLPLPAHLPGVAVGGSSHGLQGPVDARPLRHFQLFAGKPNDIFMEFLPPCVRSVLPAASSLCCTSTFRHSPTSNRSSLFVLSALAWGQVDL